MRRRRQRGLFLGSSPLHAPGPAGGGDAVERDGEPFYKITEYRSMPPFLLSVVSGHDHWMFISSTGGLTCGRKNPETALFPYSTDDKIHDACWTTGPRTVLRVARGDNTSLWQPFDEGPAVYELERNLYKNVPGNKLGFEEINRDLGLSFDYTWTSGNRFGFVRRARLINTGSTEATVEILDGLRNVLPAGVDRAAQSELSTLVDAYKQGEVVDSACAALFTLSSILTDRAEPNEALKATVVWSVGLDDPLVLLSEDQVGAFRHGEEVAAEASCRGKRCAFFVRSEFTLPPGSELSWYVLADVDQGPARTSDLLDEVRKSVSPETIDRDVAAGTERLERLAGTADGFQKSADDRATGRHFSNTLFNVMRGGVFPHGYTFPREDFLDFVRAWNRPLLPAVETAVAAHAGALTLDAAKRLADESGNEDFARLAREYLPLTFSRRHGDPSRPWNHFSIRLENADGTEHLYYEGNWRDIFQNWEALALSFPGYIESFITKFVNASTADGYNPYRISRNGIEWEVLDPQQPWSNIGYWGDHQIVYLLRLLELSLDYDPGLLVRSLNRAIHVYADVPYRIKPYRDLRVDPRNSIEYDDDHAGTIARRVDRVGADGKLVALADGSVHRVNLLEKLLVPALVKIGNLVPGGGIWMNTQRPEWNDANNALVGHGLSMVTLCHLRRYLHVLLGLLRESSTSRFAVSSEVGAYLAGLREVLEGHRAMLGGPVDAVERQSFVDAMGAANDRYRGAVYRGLRGVTAPLDKADVEGLVESALAHLDHSLELARREDGLIHAYNLIHFGERGDDVEPLDEMLEGQVAALGSGCLDADAALALLDSLKNSRLYREDQNSYLLYPDRQLPSFVDKNVIPPSLVERNEWIRRELDAGRTAYVERGGDGRVHFAGTFRNVDVLRAALDDDPDVDPADADRLCGVYEEVFAHRRFTGRSGAMYKYEGLGCIYWHMVSKLLLATAETTVAAAETGADVGTVARLRARFEEIRDGLGVHKSPAAYGAFTIDPYSHTPGFAGVQQPGLTGQVKEDVIARFRQLGVRVRRGEVVFEPLLLGRDEFLGEAVRWTYTTGGARCTEQLPAGSLGFTLCGVPVVYRLGESATVTVLGEERDPVVLPGNRLGRDRSRSLFARDGSIRKLVVDVPEAALA